MPSTSRRGGSLESIDLGSEGMDADVRDVEDTDAGNDTSPLPVAHVRTTTRASLLAPLVANLGAAAEVKMNQLVFDLSPQRLIPLQLRRGQGFDEARDLRERWRHEVDDSSRGAPGEPGGRMVRKDLWRRYGQAMHFITLEFSSTATEGEYEKDMVRRIRHWAPLGLLMRSGLSYLTALSNLLMYLVMYDPNRRSLDLWLFYVLAPIFDGFLFTAQMLQMQLDAPFVIRNFQHVAFFWAIVQASWIHCFIWFIAPLRISSCSDVVDVPTSNAIGEAQDAIGELITCLALFLLIVVRLRFVYFFYTSMYILFGYFVFVCRSWQLYGRSSACMPGSLDIEYIILATMGLSFMGYAIEVLKRKDFIQAAMIRKDKIRSDMLLSNILPDVIVSQLKTAVSSRSVAQSFDSVTILFADVVSFTTMSAQVSAPVLVELLNRMFQLIDDIAEMNGAEKIKTIGDCYMAAAGLPLPNPNHAQTMARFGLGMLKIMQSDNLKNPATGANIQIRVGMHSGPAVAGVIGTKKFAYDVWGDVVNTASRMESHGEAMRLHCSEATYLLLQHDFICEPRERMYIKGKGDMQTYFVNAEHEAAMAKSFILPVRKDRGRFEHQRNSVQSAATETSDTSGSPVRFPELSKKVRRLSHIVTSLGYEVEPTFSQSTRDEATDFARGSAVELMSVARD